MKPHLSPVRAADPRAVLEGLAYDERVVLDVTDLLGGGWIEEGIDPQQVALENYIWTMRHGAPPIVLAEGRSDIRVLETALKILRPHLAGFIRFADFSGASEGGAGALVRVVQTFASSGVANRVLAVFDNDTAARDALRKLDREELPSNLTVCQYPNLDLARQYPAIGPTGIHTTDVNGSAGSLELYLGRDALTDDAGELLPVQWTGLVQGCHQYQGEIVRKREVQRRFFEKATIALENPGARARQDWTGLETIIDMVLQQFAGDSTPQQRHSSAGAPSTG